MYILVALCVHIVSPGCVHIGSPGCVHNSLPRCVHIGSPVCVNIGSPGGHIAGCYGLLSLTKNTLTIDVYRYVSLALAINDT